MGKNKVETDVAEYFEDITSLQIVLAIHPSGVTIAKAYYNSGSGIQENLVSAALSVITTFESEIGEQMKISETKGDFHIVDYKNFTITVLDGALLRIGIISSGKLRGIMIEKCRELLKIYEMSHKIALKNFEGETSIFDDFATVVDKQLDAVLNKKCTINYLSFEAYDAPKKIKRILFNMHQMSDELFPVKIPSILIREGGVSLTEAKFFTFNAYKSYVIEPLKEEKSESVKRVQK